MSTIEENKAIARRFLTLVGEHDVEALAAMVADTWTMVGGPPELPSGPAGIRQLFATFGRIEQKWTVDDMLAEGDRVVVRATNTCTQDSFFGIPGNGRWQVFTATFTHRIVGGLIHQTWRNADDLGRLLQLGARLVPGEPEADTVGSSVDDLFRLWVRPPPADDTAAIAAFSEVYTDPVRLNGVDTSVADLVARARSLHAAFDDIHIELVDHVAAADKLAIAFRQTARHVGPLPTPLGVLAPTGRRTDGLGLDILTHTGGRISQIWVLADELQRLVQLGGVTLAAR